MEIWNQFVKQNELTSFTYNYDFVTEKIASDASAIVPIIEDVLEKMAFLYWDKYHEMADIAYWPYKEFKAVESLDKWRVISKKFVLSTDLKESAQRMVMAFDDYNEMAKSSDILAIVKEAEQLMEDVLKKDTKEEAFEYDFIKTPPFHVVEIQKISERQLNKFWCEFLVHHELEAELDLENVKSKMSYNTSALFNSISKLLRPLAFTKMHYLAAKQQVKPLAFSELQSKALKEVWAELDAFGLPTKDKAMAHQVIQTLEMQVTNKNLPKPLVQSTFNNFVYLFKSLYADALEMLDDAVEEEPVQQESVVEIEQPVEVAVVNDIKEEPIIVAPTTVGVSKKRVSKFLQQSKVLLTSAPDAVVHADRFGSLQSYMHVKRPIEEKLVQTLQHAKQQQEPQLILLCGSAGDGKSHLLAYVKETYPELVEDFIIHNDATVSKSRTKSNLETLEQLLEGFNDGQTAQKNILIAINLGVLHNFYTYEKEKQQFATFRRFIEDINIFDQTSTANESSVMPSCHVLDFSQEKNYELTKQRVESNLFKEILTKIVAPIETNVFYKAWKEDMDNGIVTAAHLNYELLQNERVQQQIIQYLVYGIFKDKLFISTRTYNEFIFSLIVPVEQEQDEQRTAIDLANTLPNLMFAHPKRSTTLATMSNNDPLKEKSAAKDEFITNVLLSLDVYGYFQEKFGDMITVFEKPIKKAILEKKFVELAQFGIRLQKLMSDEVSTLFNSYVSYLYSYLTGDEETMGELFEQLEQIVFKWRGSPEDNFIYLNNDLNREFRTAIPVSLEPAVNEDFYGQMQGETLTRFVPTMKLGFDEYFIDLDYRLYEILSSVRQGHRLNNLEVSHAMQFEEFYNAITKKSQLSDNRLMIVNTSNREKMVISKPKFSKSKYEVKKV